MLVADGPLAAEPTDDPGREGSDHAQNTTVGRMSQAVLAAVATGWTYS